ncbi:hypothetical protein CKO08_11355 [Halorhodospira halochloris]|nr:hypothetical protein [Halorhodospira halochloris]
MQDDEFSSEEVGEAEHLAYNVVPEEEEKTKEVEDVEVSVKAEGGRFEPSQRYKIEVIEYDQPFLDSIGASMNGGSEDYYRAEYRAVPLNVTYGSSHIRAIFEIKNNSETVIRQDDIGYAVFVDDEHIEYGEESTEDLQPEGGKYGFLIETTIDDFEGAEKIRVVFYDVVVAVDERGQPKRLQNFDVNFEVRSWQVTMQENNFYATKTVTDSELRRLDGTEVNESDVEDRFFPGALD